MANVNWKDKVEEVRELWEAGLTTSEIASIYQVNPRTLANMMLRYGIRAPSSVARNTKPIWPQRRDELERLAAEGKGLREMADHFGDTSIFAVGSALKRFGIKMTEEGVKKRQRERMRFIHEVPENRAKWIDAVVQRNKGSKRREIHRAQMKKQWENPEYREAISRKAKEHYQNHPEYRERVRAGSIKGGAAYKAKMEEAKRFAALTPFEQQLELVRKGKVGVVRKDRVPSSADAAFTLGGVTKYE